MKVNRNGKREPADTDVSVPFWVAVHRPQTRAEWANWYATARAVRYGLEQRGQADLAEWFGVDWFTVYDTVTRWGGPLLRPALFAEWFGACPYTELTDQ